MSEYHTIVIGGGVTGLRVAHGLTDALGADAVALLEGNETPGGNCRSETIDGFVCDWGPNGFLDKEPKTLDWIAALGLTDDLIRANEASARRFVMLNERLVEILPPPRFFMQPLLPVSGRVRLLAEPFIAQRTSDEPESVYDFARRRIGRHAADNLVSAMVLGVFGGDARALSLQHCFPVMAEMEREHGSLVKAMFARKGSGGGPAGPRGTLTALEGGIGRLTRTAADQLGDVVRTESPVKRITHQDSGGYTIETITGVTLRAQNVVITIPAARASDITLGLDDEGISRYLSIIPYARIVVVGTAYPRDAVRHDMDGFGFLVPPNQAKRTLGCIWTSSVFDSYAPDDHVFLRTMIGGARDPGAVTLDDDALLEIVTRDVHPVLGIDSAPDFVKIFRHRTGIPQYGLNHQVILDNLNESLRRHPGVYLAGNAYRGVSLNECIVDAERVIDDILEPVPAT